MGSSTDARVCTGARVAYVAFSSATRYDGHVQRVVLALVVLTGCGFHIAGGSAPVDGDPDDAPARDDSDVDAPDDAMIDPRIDAPVDMVPERVTQSLVALYTFQEGSGTTVVDRSGAGTPANLTISDGNKVQWATGTLTMTQATTIMASAPTSAKIVSACRDADAVTLEAWITPRVLDNDTLGRIATLSSSDSSLAVTLMTIASHYEFRMDGPMTDTNGLPSLNTLDNTVVVNTPRHVVLVTAPGGARRIYLDGQQVAMDSMGGDLSGWGTTNHRFAVGNEINGGREWLGTFDLVAVYARALSQTEVKQNFDAGPQ